MSAIARLPRSIAIPSPQPGPDTPRHAHAPVVAGDHLSRRQRGELLDRGVAEHELGLSGPDIGAVPVVALHRDELVHRWRVTLLDRREVPAVEHRERVHEASRVRPAGDREPGLDDPAVEDGDAGPEASTGLEARAGLADAHRTGDPDRAELLRVSLVPSAREGEVLVHPDRDASRIVFAAVPAPDHHERLLVLGAHRVEELLERVRARL